MKSMMMWSTKMIAKRVIKYEKYVASVKAWMRKDKKELERRKNNMSCKELVELEMYEMILKKE